MAMLTVRKKAFRRKAFTRKDGVRVKATNIPASTFKIKDRGRPGRGSKVLPKLKKGTLGGPGFFKKSAKGRHIIESRAAKRKGEKVVQGKLQAISTLNKRTNPDVSRKAAADRRWVAMNFDGRERL